jgi:hypothetical protein
MGTGGTAGWIYGSTGERSTLGIGPEAFTVGMLLSFD